MDTVVHDVSDPTGPNPQNGLHSDPTLRPAATSHPLLSPEEQKTPASRAEIDTSAPFESVKEAASRFGGIGFWRPASQKRSTNSPQGAEEFDIAKVEEQAAQLEKDLIAKELETFDVLKELESTKHVVEELKVKLQEASKLSDSHNADSEAKLDVAFELDEKKDGDGIDGRKTGDSLDTDSGAKKSDAAFELGEKESDENANGDSDMCVSSAPGVVDSGLQFVSVPVLLELKQAKLNLSRTTNDLAEIRATVESYNKKIEKERVFLEKTRQRLSSNTAKVSSLEEEINQTKQKLQVVKDCEDGSCDYMDVTRELQRLSSETDQCKNIGEAAKSEVLRAMLEIEQTKTRIKTAEIRLVAAKKMKEAARASEAVALAEIKALSNTENSFTALKRKPEEGITLSFEEYSSLTSKARDAEESCKRRVIDATLLVDEANVSTTEILKKVEEATEEVKTSKKALEEALSRVEAANRSKLEVEEALRKWRSERGGQRRRSIQNSTKFKNAYSTQHRKDSQLLDVNGLTLITDEAKPVLKSSLSIGQILSRKLQLAEEFENGILAEKSSGKRKVSLAQMLGKTNSSSVTNSKDDKENAHKQQQPPAKRKKFGFSRISLLVTKQSKKKKQTPSYRCRSV
ncbi:PREDICTED: WEB family protein At2g38370-like [Ipomoea nil]|uniref:WEB family protein At2g38370-like n=1 Tax=Ipomoea nil TaxID=35883 RepID=UPI000901F7C7|nr:PREDICTED: WEB family protein At2g38370-like [Ipomoea nil]